MFKRVWVMSSSLLTTNRFHPSKVEVRVRFTAVALHFLSFCSFYIWTLALGREFFLFPFFFRDLEFWGDLDRAKRALSPPLGSRVPRNKDRLVLISTQVVTCIMPHLNCNELCRLNIFRFVQLLATVIDALLNFQDARVPLNKARQLLAVSPYPTF